MTYCPKCGSNLKTAAKFCAKCGHQVKVITEEKANSTIPESPTPQSFYFIDDDLVNVTRSLNIRNSQSAIASKSWYVALFALITIILTAVDGSPVYEWFPLTLLSVFVLISAVLVAFIFRSRATKLETLINGDNLLAAWDLGEAEKKTYADHLFHSEQARNNVMFSVIAFFFVVIFGAFIIFIEEGKMTMFIIGVSSLAVIALFAFGMPYYYRGKNMTGDGRILIGAKYAYINGYFHNWDFPLSGLDKVKVISKPFRGLQLVYYYTDRTLTNSEELTIPAPSSVDLDNLKDRMIALNP